MAPLFMLLLALAVFSRSPVAVATGSSELVELTLLHDAQEKGAGIQPYIFSFVFQYLYDCSRCVCSVLGWEPAGLPAAERLRLRIPQLARLSFGNRSLFKYLNSSFCELFQYLNLKDAYSTIPGGSYAMIIRYSTEHTI